ncbi:hypothetical protein BD408DRAFT_414779 [Parasitella parasitica]|nr:hypothetical protein BD408DRAFT_414779 [Parasitella parasitica]
MMVIEATTRRLPSTQVTSPILWKQFWALFLNHSQRNVIYRLIQGKIPTKLFHYHCNPANDPHCALCLTTMESTAHFFFYCEEKQNFWERLILEYLWPGCTLRMIMDALYSLNFDLIEVLPNKSSLKPSPLLIIAITEVWKAHWRFIFDATPLTSNSLLSSFRYSVLKMQSEDVLFSSSA